jgi:hypothetical protein
MTVFTKPLIKNYRFNSDFYRSTDFNNIEWRGIPVDASIGWYDKKIRITGTFSLNLVDTAKFGPQLQFQVYGDQVSFPMRSSEKYARCEFFLPLDRISMSELVDKILRLKYFREDGIPIA